MQKQVNHPLNLAIHNVILDALRGIAALAVLLAHGDHNQLIPLDVLAISDVKGFLGKFGVGLFFILSGYLIWISARNTLPKPGGLKIYFVHRATRIMPLYYVNVCAAAFLIPAIGSTYYSDISAYTILRHLTFTQDFEPQVERALNPVLWSLSHEMLFYLLTPSLVLLMSTIRYRWLALTGLITMIPAISVLAGPLTTFAQNFYLFVIGIIAAEKIREAPPASAFFLVTIAYVVAIQIGLLSTAVSTAIGLAVVVFLGSLSIRGVGMFARKLLQPLAAIGVISYSLYIWHYLLIQVIPAHWGSIIPVMERLGLMGLWHNEALRGTSTIAVNIALASVSYWLIEKPFMGPIRGWMLKKIHA